MKLHLKNFRCHSDRYFEIPRSGLINLSGNSGDGKSTILSAITYAFYGKTPGKMRKPYTHGAKSCKVVLEYTPPDDNTPTIVITRTSKTVVTVEKDDITYEGDEAQSIIENTLNMTYQEFLAAAYIVQRSNASILSLTPTEMIKFVEILTSSSSSAELKAELSQYKSSVEDDKLRLEGEITSMMQILEGRNLPEELDIPVYITDQTDDISLQNVSNILSELDEEISNLEKTSKKIQNEILTLQKSIQKDREQAKKQKSLKDKIENVKLEIRHYQDLIDNTGEIPDIDMIEKQLEEYKHILSILERRQKLENEQKDLEEALNEHQISVNMKCKNLEANLRTREEILSMENDLDKAMELKVDYDTKKAQYDDILARKENAKKTLGSLFKEIKSYPEFSDLKDIRQPAKMVLSLELYTRHATHLACPECGTVLSLENDQLVKNSNVETNTDITRIVSDEIYDMIKEWIIKIKQISADINLTLPILNEPPNNIVAMQKELLRSKKCRDEYDSLKEEKLPPVLERMKIRLEKENESLIAIDTSYGSSYGSSYDECKQNIDVFDQNLREAKDIVKRHDHYNTELGNKTKILRDLELSLKKIGESKTQQLENDLSNKTRELMDITNELSSKRENKDSVLEYLTYLQNLEDIRILKRKIRIAEIRNEYLNSDLEGILGMESTIKEAEILALEETVRSINEHAKIYLDQMFEDPIVVRLQCEKEVKSRKTTKLQMNTSIEYKGNTYSDIEELSGGERQRCDMAFLLAVNDMLGGKILMLDECLNNLDANLNTEILSLVREMCGSERLILVISHEAVKGVFDEEIPIGNVL